MKSAGLPNQSLVLLICSGIGSIGMTPSCEVEAMRSDNVRVDKLLAIRKHPLLGQMGADVIERLANYAVSKSYKHGAVIFSKGDTGTSVFLVCVGAVKISVPSAGGRNAIFNIINEGEIFGEIAMLDGGTRTADACALTDCELLVIDRREFLPAIVSSSDAAMMLIRMLCSRLRRTSAQVEDTMFLDLPARLARMLLHSQDFSRTRSGWAESPAYSAGNRSDDRHVT